MDNSDTTPGLSLYKFLEEPFFGAKEKEVDYDSDGTESDLDFFMPPQIVHGSSSESDYNPSLYVASALRVLEFRVDTKILEIYFRPKMAHQIFGQEELIHGYTNLRIRIYILPNSFNMRLKISFKKSVASESNGCFPDDIQAKLAEWFPHFLSLQDYNREQIREDHTRMYGKVLTQYNHTGWRGEEMIYITKCEADTDFLQFHKRFQALIVFFIDAASIIDFNDPNWMYFYVYKKSIKNNLTYIMPIGFTTVYYYSGPKRARVAQFFILPRFQKEGFGSRLLGTVYKYLIQREEVSYITVEAPADAFVIMRDKLDLRLLAKHPDFSEENILSGFNNRMKKTANKIAKMAPDQAKHVFTILLYYYSEKSPMLLTRFTTLIKRNLYNTVRRKVSRHPNAYADQLRQLRRIVDDDYLKNKYIQRKTDNFISSIEPQVAFLQKLLGEYE